MKKKFLVFLLMMNLSIANESCLKFFASQGHESSENVTDNFISYIKALVEAQILEVDALVHFAQDLERGILRNPVSSSLASIKSKSYLHKIGLDKYIINKQLNTNKVITWLNEYLKMNFRIQEARTKVAADTQTAFLKMNFQYVPAGRFSFGEKNDKWITLLNPFEVMSTPVTQSQWVEIMGENPSGFKRGKYTTSMMVKDKKIFLQPDHPVENITWWSALIFANRLSEKHGLRPVYNLDGLEYRENTRAENGSLRLENEVNYHIGINAPNGHYYLAEGYRLPTIAEQEYLLRAIGNSYDKYFFGNDEELLMKYAWYNKNSGDITHPVAELLPLRIGKGEVYDLHGNVGEWSWDALARWKEDECLIFLKEGVNPLNTKVEDSSRSYHYGSSFVLFKTSQSCTKENLMYTNGASRLIGFRLVRTILGK